MSKGSQQPTGDGLSLTSVKQRLLRGFAHLHGFDWVLLVAALAIVVYLSGVVRVLPAPENPASFVALAAAVLTLATFLVTRRARRRKLRVSILSELREHQRILQGLENTDDLEDAKLKFVVYPIDIYQSQASQLGYLTKDEVEAITAYYATAERLRTCLKKIESGEAKADGVLGLNHDPTLVDQASRKLENAIKEVGGYDD